MLTVLRAERSAWFFTVLKSHLVDLVIFFVFVFKHLNLARLLSTLRCVVSNLQDTFILTLREFQLNCSWLFKAFFFLLNTWAPYLVTTPELHPSVFIATEAILYSTSLYSIEWVGWTVAHLHKIVSSLTICWFQTYFSKIGWKVCNFLSYVLTKAYHRLIYYIFTKVL